MGLVTYESLRQLTRPVDLLRLRLAQEVMTAQVITAGTDGSMLEIAQLMADREVSSVVIAVPGGSADTPFQQVVGLLTERDLVQSQAAGLILAETTAQAVMSSPVVTVAPETSLWEVQQVMDRRRIRRVVVAGEQGELLGIVTQTNLLQAFNPIELYQLAAVLEQKVVQLEMERVALLQSQAAELEWHITESNQAMRMQAEFDRLLQGFALATTQLMTIQDGQASVQAALDALGSALRVDRSYIFENHPHPTTGEMAVSQRWEWVAEGVTPQIDNPDLQNIPFAEVVPSWYESLERGQTVVGLTKDFPAEEQAHLIPQGIVSILLVPIFIQDCFWGLVGFDDCHGERVWEDSTQSALKAIAGTIGSAIARRRAETNAMLLAKRLQEAQRIAHLGNWELDLQQNTLYWSEEVFCIFEIDAQQFGASYQAFLDLVHPDDRTLIDEAYTSHLRDRQPYRLVHRLQMPDGRIKYVQEQCETTYSADGTPVMSQGTVQDITQQHVAELRRDRAEASLRQVIEGTAAVTGEAFFPALVRHISAALGVRYVSIDQAMTEGFQSLAFSADGKLAPPLFLPYDQIPCCFTSLQAGSCCHPTGVQALYPDNALLKDLQVDSYLGVRLQNAAGDPIGNLCILHDAPLVDADWAQTLLTIFAARAGAELERLMTAQALEQLNAELEARVAERTAALAEREALLQDFLDNANDLIQIVDIDTGRFEFVNRAWRDVLGYTTAAVTQLTYFDVLAPDGLPHYQTVIAQMRSGDVTHLEQMELTFVGKSGHRVVVEGNVNCRFVTEADGSQRPVSIRGIFRDVTAKKATDQELQRREARYRALLEGASDAILLANTEGYIIEANQKAAVLLGYDSFELVGMHFAQLHAPEHLPRASSAFADLASQARSQVLNVEFLRQDGQRVPVDVTASVIEVDGETIIQGIFHDLRERLQTEQALRESEIRFRRVFESNVVGMIFADFSGRISDANDRFLEMLGYTRHDLESGDGLNWADLTPLEYQAQDEAAIDHLQHHGSIPPWEKAYRHKDGHLVQVLIGVAMLSREDESSVCAVVDISDRKQAEQTMRQQAEREAVLREITQRIRQSLDLSAILNTTVEQMQHTLQADRVAVYQFRPDWSGDFIAESVHEPWVKLVNSNIQKVWEDTYLQETQGGRFQNHESFVIPDIYQAGLQPCHIDLLEQFQAKAFAIAPIFSGETLWGLLAIYQNETCRQWLPWEVELLQQIASQLAIAIQQASLYEQLQQELTERQQAQAQLTQRNAELTRATRLKDEFLANMSHELRTPLNAILGMTEALQEEDVFGSVNAQQLKALKTVERSGSHLLELINDVLDVAKIEAGQVELDCTPTAIAPLCHSSLAFVKQPALKKRIQLTVNLPANLPTISIDERRIRQVLINLLNNAVKFTPEGGQITLEVTSLAPTPSPVAPAYLRFAVTDTGIGISPAEQQRLFQPFVQVDSALNREYQGTGLGLALVKRIVELHQGRVGLTSEVGIGSCFTFDLPYTKRMAPIADSNPNSSPEAPSSTAAAHSAPAPLILLAEDNEANISTMVSYLQAKGYRVDVAHNGQEALDRLQHLRPDLILMDIQMPRMDGLEAIGHIRLDPSLDQVPVIALTSLAMPGDRDRCLAAGATEYLSKPVRLKQLVEIIETLLSSSRHHPPPPEPTPAPPRS